MKAMALGDLTEIVSGATPKSGVDEYWGGEVLWATPADLSKLSGAMISVTPRTLTREGLKSCAARELPPGSVLLSSRAPIGHVAINTVPMATNQGFKNLVPDADRLDSWYLYYWLRSRTDLLQRLGNGATFKELSKATVERIKIPAPPIEEQRRVVKILAHVDSLASRQSQVLESSGALAESIFHEMFGNEPAVVEVRDLATRIRTGPFGSQLLHEEFVDDGVAVLGLDNVIQNEFLWAKRRYITPEKYAKLLRYTVQPKDVLVSIMGTTGRCVVVPEDIPVAINTKHLCAITANQTQLEPEFLRAAFLYHSQSRAHLRRQTKGSIMDGLNMGIIKSMPVPAPSLDRQREFASRIGRVSEYRAATSRRLAAGRALFASLQARAFRGEL